MLCFPLAILWAGSLVGLSWNGLSLLHVVSARLTFVFVVSWQVGWWLAPSDGLVHMSGSRLELSASLHSLSFSGSDQAFYMTADAFHKDDSGSCKVT